MFICIYEPPIHDDANALCHFYLLTSFPTNEFNQYVAGAQQQTTATNIENIIFRLLHAWLAPEKDDGKIFAEFLIKSLIFDFPTTDIHPRSVDSYTMPFPLSYHFHVHFTHSICILFDSHQSGNRRRHSVCVSIT